MNVKILWACFALVFAEEPKPQDASISAVEDQVTDEQRYGYHGHHFGGYGS